MARLQRAYQMWEVAGPVGTRLGELVTATGRTLTYQRNGSSEAAFTISHEDDSAQLLMTALASGVPRLKVWRFAPPYTTGRLVFYGYLAPFNEDAEETALIQAVFRSPFSILLGDGSDRGRFTAASVAFAATDAGQIAKQLIDTTNADSFTGLATAGGTIEATVNRDRTYQFANVGESVVNLTNVINGFDFEEQFVDSGATMALFNVHTSLDSARPLARFEYGPATINNVRSLSRTTQPPVNCVVVLGANGLSGTATDAGSVATYGKWYKQVSASDVTEQATLDAKASALIRPLPVTTLSFVPEYALESCPQPWDDFWIGSACPVYARRGALVVNSSVRINAATVTVDDNGFEVTAIPNPLDPDGEADLLASLTVEVVS